MRMPRLGPALWMATTIRTARSPVGLRANVARSHTKPGATAGARQCLNIAAPGMGSSALASQALADGSWGKVEWPARP